MEESQKQGLRSAVHEIRQNAETYTVLLRWLAATSMAPNGENDVNGGRNTMHCALTSYTGSEREFTFTFAVCRRPSVCRLSVCRL